MRENSRKKRGRLKLFVLGDVNIVLFLDSHSGWLCGEILPVTEDKNILASRVATFILDIFTNLGFITLSFVNFDNNLFSLVSQSYRILHDGLSREILQFEKDFPVFIQDSTGQLDRDEQMDMTESSILSLATCRNSGEEYVDLATQFNFIIWRHRLTHHKQMPMLGDLRKHENIEYKGKCFATKAVSRRLVKESPEDEESTDDGSEEKFTQKIRSKKYLEEDEIQESEDKKKLEQITENKKVAQVAEKVVENVHTFLHHTKEERTKRGQYMTYDKKERKAIKEYALKFGVKETARIFSAKMGQHVAETTVRSISSDSIRLSQQLKLQIGKYADIYGGDQASRHFTTLLGRQITKSSITRFVKQYKEASTAVHPGYREAGTSTAVHPGYRDAGTGVHDQSLDYRTSQNKRLGESQDVSVKSSNLDDRIQEPDEKSSSNRVYTRYSAATRTRMLKFLHVHGVAATARHFSKELGTSVNESTVRSMRDKFVHGRKGEGGRSRGKGRPAVMGAHDNTLIQSLTRLKEKGEVISSFSVIATAKQILQEVGPDEINESGLTKTWAKSVVRRFNQTSDRSQTVDC